MKERDKTIPVQATTARDALFEAGKCYLFWQIENGRRTMAVKVDKVTEVDIGTLLIDKSVKTLAVKVKDVKAMDLGVLLIGKGIRMREEQTWDCVQVTCFNVIYNWTVVQITEKQFELYRINHDSKFEDLQGAEKAIFEIIQANSNKSTGS